MKFQRQPLRRQIQQEILTRVVDGRLAAGQRINETHLAEELGLSRTPLREAMLTLAAQGHLQSRMGKGFAVPALEPTEFGQIQLMLAALQPEVLALSMPLEPGRHMEISNALNRGGMNLERATPGGRTGMALAGFIFSWHQAVLGQCPASFLAAQTTRLEELAARYWFAAGSSGWDSTELRLSLTGCYEIIRRGDTARACAIWAEHIGKYGKDAESYLAGSQD